MDLTLERCGTREICRLGWTRPEFLKGYHPNHKYSARNFSMKYNERSVVSWK